MATIGLIIRPGIERAVGLGREVLAWAQKRGHGVVCEQATAKLLGPSGSGELGAAVGPKELVSQADPIVVLGGDGTLIGVAHYAVSERSPVMVGVNFGHLGFLTEIAPTELFEVLEGVFAGSVTYGERSMLRTEVIRNGKVVFSGQAINEAVVQKGAEERLVDLDLFVDREAVMRLRADGLIISTSTGSTAYSLAAGGSIVYPSLPVVLVTPLCPHSLTSRPLILRLDSELSVSVPLYDGKVYLSIDGQISEPLQSGDVVRLSRAKTTVRFVRSPSKSYFEILRTKLNWGIPNKPD